MICGSQQVLKVEIGVSLEAKVNYLLFLLIIYRFHTISKSSVHQLCNLSISLLDPLSENFLNLKLSELLLRILGGDNHPLRTWSLVWRCSVHWNGRLINNSLLDLGSNWNIGFDCKGNHTATNLHSFSHFWLKFN